MRRTTLLVTALTMAVAILLTTARPADAHPFRPGMPTPGNRMPGWDWWRTYPWSAYNYGRNPYNPAILPYPNPYYGYDPNVFLPGYVPEPPNPQVQAQVQAAIQALQQPTVTGPLKTPPPGTGLLRVRVPEVWAKVTINGQDTATSGLTRYFVTPRLEDGRPRTYTVSASWISQGRAHREQQVVQIQPGQTRAIDLTRVAE